MAKGTITITAEEYREFLLKEQPTDKDREVLKRIFDIIEQNLSYDDRGYDYSNTVMEKVKVEESKKILVEIFTMLKYVDFDKYMDIWNKVMTNERKRKEQEERIKHMNEAKELRKEAENE